MTLVKPIIAMAAVLAAVGIPGTAVAAAPVAKLTASSLNFGSQIPRDRTRPSP